MGYVAAAALAVMVATGPARRRIAKVFRKAHGALAFVFCGALIGLALTALHWVWIYI